MVAETVVGVLALQGSFAEHLASLSNFPAVRPIAVTTPAHLSQCSALIIPGGESSAISLLAQSSGLIEPLREFVKSGKPVWGTCAGMILLSDEVVDRASDLEEKGRIAPGFVGGARVRVVRNQWGRQAQSTQRLLELPFLPAGAPPFLTTFIRAPMVHSMLSPKTQALLTLPPSELPPDKDKLGPDAGVVMLRDGSVVAMAFHPEIGDDTRVHEWWLNQFVLDRR